MLNLCADGVQVNLSWDLLDIFAHRHVSVDANKKKLRKNEVICAAVINAAVLISCVKVQGVKSVFNRLNRAKLKTKLLTYVVKVWGQQIEGAEVVTLLLWLNPKQKAALVGNHQFPWVNGPRASHKATTTLICPKAN